MKHELDNKLVTDFPQLYANRYAPMDLTAMCWGFECEDGWYDIIYELSEKLSSLPTVPVANQVKEKYGTLRFYIYNGSDEAFDLIQDAEHKSETTCEMCGEQGKLRGGGWLKTLCDKHATALDYCDHEPI